MHRIGLVLARATRPARCGACAPARSWPAPRAPRPRTTCARRDGARLRSAACPARRRAGRRRSSRAGDRDKAARSARLDRRSSRRTPSTAIACATSGNEYSDLVLEQLGRLGRGLFRDRAARPALAWRARPRARRGSRAGCPRPPCRRRGSRPRIARPSAAGGRSRRWRRASPR